MRNAVTICLMALLLASVTVLAQGDDRSRYKALLNSVQAAYDKHSDSLQYFVDRTLPLARKLHDTDASVRIQRLLGMNYFFNGHSDKAIQILIPLAKESEKRTATLESASLYYAIAQVYSKNEYHAISKEYILKGRAISLKFNNDQLLADGYNMIGIWYERQNLPDSALAAYKQALVHTENIGADLGKAYCLENIAGIYARKGNLRAALSNQQLALSYKLQKGQKLDVAIGFINVGETFDSLKQYDSALVYGLKALHLANEINYKDLVTYSYHFLSGIYALQGDYKKALAYHTRYSELSDTIYNETKTRQLAELNTRYQTEKKEQEIKELNNRTTIQTLQLKQRNILLFVAACLIIAGAAIAYLTYNRRKLKEQARLQAERNRQQAITVREVLNAEERERKRIAADLHDGVGQMLSATLLNLNNFFNRQKIAKHTDPQADRILSLVTESYDELRSISHQMMPNALLKSGLGSAIKELVSRIDQQRLAVTFEAIGLNERLSEDVETVLYRVIQESVTNVIKHANATTLNLQIINDEDGVAVTIEDNGKGFDMKPGTSGGIGMKNIYSRVQFQNGTVDIDSQPGKGTLVAIHIPNRA